MARENDAPSQPSLCIWLQF